MNDFWVYLVLNFILNLEKDIIVNFLQKKVCTHLCVCTVQGMRPIVNVIMWLKYVNKHLIVQTKEVSKTVYIQSPLMLDQ